jgi:ankyrin repeat protein
MKIKSFLSRLSHPPISLLAIVTLIALAWSIPAFCGEIHDAAKAGDLAKVKALLKEKPELVSGKNDDGWTPLQVAASYGNKDVAVLLLAKGAAVNANINYNNPATIPLSSVTPLHMAAEKGHKAVVELLLAHGAAVNAKDIGGWMPLHMAAEKGHNAVVELLLAHGVEVNAKDNVGVMPLHLAAEKGHKDVVELLLANKADVNAKDNLVGWTPLHYATAGGHKDVVELLRQHGGQE